MYPTHGKPDVPTLVMLDVRLSHLLCRIYCGMLNGKLCCLLCMSVLYFMLTVLLYVVGDAEKEAQVEDIEGQENP